MRYMGTKRRLAPTVKSLADGLSAGPIVDLFAGTAAVGAAHAGARPVVLNDNLQFAAGMAREQFLDLSYSPRVDWPDVVSEFRRARAELMDPVGGQIAAEEAALMRGWRSLEREMAGAKHPGNCENVALEYAEAARTPGVMHYRMATLLHANGYFSTRQAVELDALRFALDVTGASRSMLGALIHTAAHVMNSPGHAAQYLRSHNENSHARIRRAWQMDVISVFEKVYASYTPLGTRNWRRSNKVLNLDASEAATEATYGVAYADPPYTKDLYSRYYHVHESIWTYGFPAISNSRGRYPVKRIPSDFSRKTSVEPALDRLCRGVAARGADLILSYPENGLLESTGVRMPEILLRHFKTVRTTKVAQEYSTMGGSVARRPTVECLYVCSGGSAG